MIRFELSSSRSEQCVQIRFPEQGEHRATRVHIPNWFRPMKLTSASPWVIPMEIELALKRAT